MSEQERETFAAEGRVSVTIEETAKGPRWRVRTTDAADDETIERVSAQAVAAYRRLAHELDSEAAKRAAAEERLAALDKAGRPFSGEEPTAP